MAAVRKLAVCVFVLLIFSNRLPAALGTLVASYSQIPVSNVFRLKTPEIKLADIPRPPLPRIVLVGITTILGDKRALIKVKMPAVTDLALKEQSLMLAEGQQEGPIRILKIDENARQIEVNNSGTIMVITFEKESPVAPGILPLQGMIR